MSIRALTAVVIFCAWSTFVSAHPIPTRSYLPSNPNVATFALTYNNAEDIADLIRQVYAEDVAVRAKSLTDSKLIVIEADPLKMSEIWQLINDCERANSNAKHRIAVVSGSSMAIDLQAEAIIALMRPIGRNPRFLPLGLPTK